ncbi:MAG: UDP-N-acetylmuramate--L-alanine ligase [Rhizobiales bacterium]|nr:UDP-N-acetylmuramate--L-alanine ligase [Hyphomicrobiales bacterium]
MIENNENKDLLTIHFIGIGGIGLSAIAKLCLHNGYNVQGSDIKNSDILQSLENMGIKVFVGHNSDNINANIGKVVYSSAVKNKNPEFIKAKDLNIPIYSRAQMLAEVMQKKKSICISGTHGKTSCTSMTSWILSYDKIKPTTLIGGIDYSFNSNLQIGDGNWMVVEADESDKTFLSLPSDISLVTNIDDDHMENYGTMKNVERSFLNFANNIKEGGYFLYFRDNPISSKVFSHSKSPNTISYGTDKRSDVIIKNIEKLPFGHKFDLSGFINGKKYNLNLRINVPGVYNVWNSTAAVVIGLLNGIAEEKIIYQLAKYKGVYRRFSSIIEKSGIRYFDDYAHHPTEINQLLKSAKEEAENRVITIFQPHRYSRTLSLYDSFCNSFKYTDRLGILPIYAAGEEYKNIFDYWKFAEDIKKKSNTDTHFLSKREISKFLKNITKEGDIVLFVGAGDINEISKAICKEI